MKIFIEEPNRAEKARFYLGDKDRMATMTSVKFIDNNKLVACHLVGEKMLAYRLNANANANANANEKVLEPLCSIPTTFQNKPTITDLLDYDGVKYLVTSNFDGRSGSLYTLDNDQLSYCRDLELPDGAGNCHAARFYNTDTICLGTNKNDLYFLNKSDGKIISRLELPFHPKDFCFLEGDRMMVLFAVKSPSKTIQPLFASGLQLIRLTPELDGYKTIKTRFFKPAAFDAITLDKQSGTFYFTDQYADRVIVAKLDGNRIDVVGELDGFDFPHGVDVNEQYLAVTNYGDSSINFIDKSQLQVVPLKGYTGYFRPYTQPEIRQAVFQGLKKIPGLLALKRVVFR